MREIKISRLKSRLFLEMKKLFTMINESRKFFDNDMYVIITKYEIIIFTIYCVSKLVYLRYETSISKTDKYKLSSTFSLSHTKSTD